MSEATAIIEHMNDTIDALGDLGSRLHEVVSGTLEASAMRGWSDDEVMAVMDAAASLSRRAEALIAEATGEVQARSDSPVAAERMTTRFGCRNVREFVQRVTRVSGRTAGDYARAGVATASTLSVLTGEVLPARYPAMRAALADGAVGVDAVVAVVQTLDSAAIDSHEARTAADAELAAAARGGGADGGGLPSADELRLQAQVWAAYLDPDGAEPRDEAAQRKRGLTLGRCRNGLVPLRGDLLPDVAAQLKRAIDAIVHPRAGRVHFTDGDEGGEDGEAECPPDPRTHPQKNHDALATIVTVAARSGELPTIGGAAPTLVVSVRADDLAAGEGVGHIDGIDEPVPMAVVRHAACNGGIYRTTLARNGRIERVEVIDRVFNALRSPSETADASFPAATFRPRGARSTTSANTPAADPPAPTTEYCSAGITTAPSTPTDGTSACAAAFPKCVVRVGGIPGAGGAPSRNLRLESATSSSRGAAERRPRVPTPETSPADVPLNAPACRADQETDRPGGDDDERRRPRPHADRPPGQGLRTDRAAHALRGVGRVVAIPSGDHRSQQESRDDRCDHRADDDHGGALSAREGLVHASIVGSQGCATPGRVAIVAKLCHRHGARQVERNDEMNPQGDRQYAPVLELTFQHRYESYPPAPAV